MQCLYIHIVEAVQRPKLMVSPVSGKDTCGPVMLERCGSWDAASKECNQYHTVASFDQSTEYTLNDNVASDSRRWRISPLTTVPVEYSKTQIAHIQTYQIHQSYNQVFHHLVHFCRLLVCNYNVYVHPYILIYFHIFDIPLFFLIFDIPCLGFVTLWLPSSNVLHTERYVQCIK